MRPRDRAFVKFGVPDSRRDQTNVLMNEPSRERCHLPCRRPPRFGGTFRGSTTGEEGSALRQARLFNSLTPPYSTNEASRRRASSRQRRVRWRVAMSCSLRPCSLTVAHNVPGSRPRLRHERNAIARLIVQIGTSDITSMRQTHESLIDVRPLSIH